jgi:hypothetical protein
MTEAAGVPHQAEAGTGWRPVRYSEVVDVGAVRAAVRVRLDQDRGSTLAEIADELRCQYPDRGGQMAVLLRGMMAAELRRRIWPESSWLAAGESR